jgi:hypothetical protein
MPDRDVFQIICRRCGAYRVSEEFTWEMPKSYSPLYELRYRMSWVLRTASERISDLADLPVYLRVDVPQLLSTPDPSVDDKLGFLLTFLARRSKSPGKRVFFDYVNDCSVVCARDKEEASFLFESLGQQRLIELQDQILDGTGGSCRLTTAGWSELTRRASSGAESNNVFIAMSFDPTRTSVAKAIAQAISASHHTPFRMDQVEHLNRIDDEILSRLRSSKFLVVDLTQQNPGAYFEAGFMLGLGRPVIWICSDEDMEKVHFDARQYNFIYYDGIDDLERRLRLRIEATIGKGTKAR